MTIFNLHFNYHKRHNHHNHLDETISFIHKHRHHKLLDKMIFLDQHQEYHPHPHHRHYQNLTGELEKLKSLKRKMKISKLILP